MTDLLPWELPGDTYAGNPVQPEGYESPKRDKRTEKARIRLSADEEAELRARTNCDVCGRRFTKTNPRHIDHCHKTGKTRGALCRDCNWVLGWARDNPWTLRGLADYLERNR